MARAVAFRQMPLGTGNGRSRLVPPRLRKSLKGPRLRAKESWTAWTPEPEFKEGVALRINPVKGKMLGRVEVVGGEAHVLTPSRDRVLAVVESEGSRTAAVYVDGEVLGRVVVKAPSLGSARVWMLDERNVAFGSLKAGYPRLQVLKEHTVVGTVSGVKGPLDLRLAGAGALVLLLR